MVKKIMLILLIISSLLFKVAYAKTYYSDYSEYSPYSEDYIESSDEVYVESKKMYHAYKVEEKEVRFDDLSLSLDDYREFAIFDEPVEYEDLDTSKRYDICHTYVYNELKGYRYFLLRNNDHDVNVKSIKFYNEDEDSLVREIGSFKLYENDIYIFAIYTGEEYPISELRLEIELEETDYFLELYVDEDSNPFNGSYVLSSFVSNIFSGRNTIIIDNFEDYDDIFEEDYNISVCGNAFGRIVSDDVLYRNYQIFNYKCEEEKVYLDLYTDIESPDYLLDYDDFKTYYRSKKRDKVDIKDNIVIDTDSFTNNDLFNYSSIPIESIDIVSDIDLTKNGTYDITYILPFKKVDDIITVDIKSNYIDLIKAEEEIIENLENKIDESIYKVEKKNQEIKEVISTYSEEINNLTKEVETYKEVVNSIEKEEIEEPVKETDHLKQSISLIGLIILLLISITISNYIKKENKDVK